jgi:hypothetical protein
MAKQKHTIRRKPDTRFNIRGEAFYRNVVAFDQHGNFCGQVEFSVGAIKAKQTSQDTEKRLEAFQNLAMRFLSGSDDWQFPEEFDCE